MAIGSKELLPFYRRCTELTVIFLVVAPACHSTKISYITDITVTHQPHWSQEDEVISRIIYIYIYIYIDGGHKLTQRLKQWPKAVRIA